MPTVLVVDDLKADRLVAGGLLEKNTDCKVIYAIDGREALAQLDAQSPDLVVTDLQMPEMNGLELVKAIKTDYPHIPVILMTAQGSEEIAVEALQTGAASYVTKSRLARDLPRTVQQVLETVVKERSFEKLLERMLKNEMSFDLENDLSLTSALASFLRQSAVQLRFCNEADSLHLAVALDEALRNALYHGNLELDPTQLEKSESSHADLVAQRAAESPYCDRQIHINAHLTPEKAVYTIRDGGTGFDLSLLPDPTDPANLEQPCGRGVLLMRIFMDEVHFSDRANEVTLVKYRSVDDLLDSSTIGSG